MSDRKGPGGRKLAESDEVRKVHLGRRLAQPLVLTGFGPGKFKVLTLKEMDELQLGPYQRLKIGNWVNVLIHVLMAGGEIPQPITVSQRPDGSRYIVDGQQRYWACVEAKHPCPAMIYEVGGDFLRVEEMAFIILNHNKAVRSNYIVHAWPGEVGDLIRKAGESPQSPLFNRVMFGSNNKSRVVEASVLTRSICFLLSEGEVHGSIHAALGTADTLLRLRPQGRRMAEAFFQLLGNVFVKGRCYHHVVAAFAVAARRRWDTFADPHQPTAKELASLRRVNWRTAAPSAEVKYRSMLVELILNRWK
jgi:hypothetical protein